MSTDSTSPGKIFNVAEATGKDAVAHQTTTAEARLHATDRSEAFQIGQNSEKAHDAAQQAAAVAKTHGSDLTGEPTTAAGKFQEDASRTTNAAVAEGKHDVDQAKAVGAGYVDQAKSLAGAAVGTAQAYLPTALGGTTTTPSTTTTRSTDPNAPGVVTQIKDTAVNAYTTTAAAAAPHVETLKGTATYAMETAQPHIEKAVGVVQGYMGTAGTQGAQLAEHGKTATPASSASVPAATTAPLESGKHTVDSPYATSAAPHIAGTTERN